MTTKAHPYGISHNIALGSCDVSSFISSSTLQLPDNKTANDDLPRNPYDVGFYREKDILDQSSGKSQPINVMIDSNLKKKISENRKKLVPVVDTIILAGRLQLPLRGHRDDSQYHPEVGEYSEKHNELIRCCGQFFTEQLLVEVKKSTFYALIADETCDISNKEQMSLVLRFVDEEFNIREEFFRFIHCSEGMSGKDLASVILKSLNEELNLNIQDCRGQWYDGAGAVAGCINGLAARIKNLNDKAIYTHCFSHRLNLSICGTCAVQYVRNVLEHVKEVANFFNSSQCRQLILENCIGENGPDFAKKRLRSACKTRWVERISSLHTVEELYVAIVFSLEEMSFNVEDKCNR
ncbi:52 kDa repressor of the inhibitor of the protein kinase-like [Xenia sp. Carnegie-2017]|uniref:52 kDa repressor of the inhibitor of the protein kinase-like n=1 Tax=Xenia sp. Carnegie-2017 TaxID=2897299 RepID=UPI001F033927|nr:52 kDa repressor of the inhibitor of the protein kinase-like [Xenia sp. Carnegie-2017]